jgi:DNA (cytosine-5)-methyltransferase 3A
MKKKYSDIITDMLGVKPIEINSSLMSAQSRKRMYWTNIPNVKMPNDKGITLKDISLSQISNEELLNNSIKIKDLIVWNDPEKIDGNDYTVHNIFNIDEETAIIQYGSNEQEYLSEAEVYLSELCIINKKQINLKKYNGETFINPRNFGGKGYIGTNNKSVAITLPSGNNATLVKTKFGHWRSLTPNECEQLQNVPLNYTKIVPNMQRYKMLGNGWTVDVIAHIFKSIIN